MKEIFMSYQDIHFAKKQVFENKTTEELYTFFERCFLQSSHELYIVADQIKRVVGREQ